MNKLLILLLFTFGGCMSGSIINKKNDSNPIVIQKEDIEFEDIDLNEDGDISRQEVKVFNKSNKTQSAAYETSAPIWVTVGIISLTLVMCLVSALIKCNKSE
tara:strand:+ start:29 stop:334 length:306 start_codon:yes stop_codon:yes gene_type:complete